MGVLGRGMQWVVSTSVGLVCEIMFRGIYYWGFYILYFLLPGKVALYVYTALKYIEYTIVYVVYNTVQVAIYVYYIYSFHDVLLVDEFWVERVPQRHSALVLYVTIAIMCLLLYCSWFVGCGEVYNNIIATNGPATFH